MYCPNCGKTNSAEQSYCRGCGLGLEKIVDALVEQRPVATQNQELKEKQRKVDRALTIVGASAVSIVVLSVLFGIVYKIMIVKGAIVEGAVFLAFIVGIIVFALLAIYSDSLTKAAGKPASQDPTLIKEPVTAKLLPDTLIEPVPSVTERTTELLMAEKTGRKENE